MYSPEVHVERIRAATVLAQSEVILSDIHLTVCDFFKREFAGPEQPELEKQFAEIVVDTPWGRVRLTQDEEKTHLEEVANFLLENLPTYENLDVILCRSGGKAK